MKAQAGKIFFIRGNDDAFFYFDCLMQAVSPGTIGHDSAGELVDDLDFLILADEVLLVADETVVADEGLRDDLAAQVHTYRVTVNQYSLNREN